MIFCGSLPARRRWRTSWTQHIAMLGTVQGCSRAAVVLFKGRGCTRWLGAAGADLLEGGVVQHEVARLALRRAPTLAPSSLLCRGGGGGGEGLACQMGHKSMLPGTREKQVQHDASLTLLPVLLGVLLCPVRMVPGPAAAVCSRWGHRREASVGGLTNRVAPAGRVHGIQTVHACLTWAEGGVGKGGHRLCVGRAVGDGHRAQPVDQLGRQHGDGRGVAPSAASRPPAGQRRQSAGTPGRGTAAPGCMMSERRLRYTATTRAASIAAPSHSRGARDSIGAGQLEQGAAGRRFALGLCPGNRASTQHCAQGDDLLPTQHRQAG